MTETFNKYLNKISQYLAAQNDQGNIHQFFQCLIVYRKIINNYSTDQTISIPIKESIQEDLLRFGLVSKRGGCLQITSRIHESCFDTDWVDQQLSKNSIFRQISYWAEEDKFLDDKLCDLIFIEESNIGSSVKDWVKDCLVKSQLIEGWENGDDVYHQNWRTIRNDILYSDEETRRSILELHQNILQNIPVKAKKEYEVLLRLNLIVENGQNLKIAKNIYQLVFSQTWVQTELNKLPPKTTPEVPQTDGRKLSWWSKWWSKLKIQIRGLVRKVKLYWILSLLVCSLIILFQGGFVSRIIIENKGLRAINKFNELGGQLSSLVLATEYGQELKNLIKNNNLAETAYQLFPLQYILENIYQKNEFKEGNGSVTSLGFIQDSQNALILVASAGEYGSIRLWNLSDRSKYKLIIPKVVDQGIIKSISCNLKDKFFATSGTKNKTIKFWNTSGQQIDAQDLMYKTGEITSIKFSPNGNILATVLSLGEQGLVTLWQVEFNDKVDKGKIKLIKVADLKGDKKIETVSFNVDGTLIATAEEEGTVRLWDISGKERKTIIKDQQGGIKGVNFSPDTDNKGNLIATAGKNGTVMLRDLDGNPQLSILTKVDNEERNVNFSPDGKFIAITGNTEKVQLWKLQDLQNKDNKVDDYPLKKAHKEKVSSVIFIPTVGDKYYLATGGGDKDKTVRLWDLSKFEKEPYPEEKGLKIIGIGEDPYKTQRLLIFKEDGSVELLKLGSKESIYLRNQSGNKIKAKSVDISSNKKKIITVDDNGEVKFWDFSGKLLPLVNGQLQTEKNVRNIILGSDSYFKDYFVIIEKDRNASIWDLSNPKKILYNNNNKFNNAIVHPKDEIIATIDGTEKVKFWNLKGELFESNLDSISSNNGIKSMKFSPDGKFLAVVGVNQTINLWEIAKQEKENSISVKDKWQKSIDKATMVEFSYNGELIATYGDDNLVKVWDLKGRQVAEFSGDWQETVSLSFDTNTTKNTKIFAAGENGKVYEWVIKDLDALLKDSCLWLKDDYFKFHPDNKEKLCP